VATQHRPDLQVSTAKQNSALCILGVNRIAPKFVTLVATYIYIYTWADHLIPGLIFFLGTIMRSEMATE